MRKALVAIGVVGLSFVLTACNPFSSTKESSPDPTSEKIQMVPPVQVIGMPEGFRNIALACDKFGNLWAVTSRGSDFAGGPNGGGLGSGVSGIAQGCKK